MKRFPGNREFAFTIVDDTDHATVENVGPVYRLLGEFGFRTTKTVWVRPPRDHFTGQTLEDPEYLAFIRDLRGKGFEIALHNVGSGAFIRDEILTGLETFRELLGGYPRLHVNHVSNPDNLYWRSELRFPPLVGRIYWLLSSALPGRSGKATSGEDPDSPHFWGDAAKEHIKYIRNLTFQEIDTLRCDPLMPYRERRKAEFSNFWFSSSDGHTVTEFVDLLDPKKVDRLQRRGGACIVYTHFASGFSKDGKVHSEFEHRLRYLASLNGWFVPASELLDFLVESRSGKDHFVSEWYLLRTSLRWIGHRILKQAKIHRRR